METSGFGSSRHFAAAQQPRRFRSKADINFDASRQRVDASRQRVYEYTALEGIFLSQNPHLGFSPEVMQNRPGLRGTRGHSPLPFHKGASRSALFALG